METFRFTYKGSTVVIPAEWVPDGYDSIMVASEYGWRGRTQVYFPAVGKAFFFGAGIAKPNAGVVRHDQSSHFVSWGELENADRIRSAGWFSWAEKPHYPDPCYDVGTHSDPLNPEEGGIHLAGEATHPTGQWPDSTPVYPFPRYGQTLIDIVYPIQCSPDRYPSFRARAAHPGLNGSGWYYFHSNGMPRENPVNEPELYFENGGMVWRDGIPNCYIRSDGVFGRERGVWPPRELEVSNWDGKYPRVFELTEGEAEYLASLSPSKTTRNRTAFEVGTYDRGAEYSIRTIAAMTKEEAIERYVSRRSTS